MSGLGYVLMASWSLMGTSQTSAPEVNAMERDQRIHQTLVDWDFKTNRNGVRFSPRAELGTSMVMLHVTIGRPLNHSRVFSIADDSRANDCDGAQMRRIIEKVADADSFECDAPVARHPRSFEH